MNDIPRNAPCPCGSGKKYKRCCLQNNSARTNNQQADDGLEMSYQRAVVLYQHGHLQAAGTMCEQLLRKDSNNVPVLELSAGIALELGNKKFAANCLLKQLELQPKNAHVHCNLGMVLHALGKNEEAYQHCQKALALQPDFAEVYDRIGNIHESRNNLQKALESYEKALELGMKDPRVFVNAGNVSQMLGDLQAAENHFRRAIEQDSSYAPAHKFLGSVLLKNERYHEAETAFQYVLKQYPNDPEAHSNLGVLWMGRGDLDKAQSCFEQALHLDANYVGAYTNLGHLFEERNNIPQSQKHYKKALDLEPSNQQVKALLDTDNHEYESAEVAWRRSVELKPNEQDGYLGLASLFSKQGRYEDAQAMFKQVENIAGGSVKLYSQWSKMEESFHNLDAAECLAKKAVELNPDYAGYFLLQAKLLRRRKQYEAALQILQQVKVTSIDSKQLRAEYWFELGRMQDKLGHYKEAFDAYNAANQIKNDYIGASYNAEEDEKWLHEQRAFYSDKNWKQLKKVQLKSKATTPTPIFIVGFPRSGTSLLEQMLGSHSQIAAAGELPYVDTIAKRKCAEIIGSKEAYPKCLIDPSAPLNKDGLELFRDFYLANMEALGVADEATGWVTDKMPHNILYMGLINLLFPESPIIHITRHPLDACLSAYSADFKSAHRYTSSLASTAIHYTKVMETLAHYKQILDVPLLEIRYEDLVEDQESMIHRLLDFIGAPWDDCCLQHHKSKRMVRTASYEQVTQKVYSSSVYRYQNYRDAVEPIIPTLEATIQYLGYSVD